ncbi:helix-turn-helix transcriptional regulator [bacterium]|nr:helix-turn-helix transcriptional regulator [bacterium]
MNKEELLKRFGKNVKIERIKKDLTAEQFAEIMDVSVSYLSCIERGKENMSLAKVLELANYLEVDIKTLLDFS